MELKVGHKYQVFQEIFPEGPRTLMQNIKSFLEAKNPDLSIITALLETKRHLHIVFLIFSKSSMKKGNGDIRIFGFQAKQVLKDKHHENGGPLDNKVICIKGINPF